MKKHKFNIFPPAKPEDFDRLCGDIRDNGYDKGHPIILYEGCVLDGWNRKLACDKLNIEPETKQFVGHDLDAIAFVMRTNKRRNLSSAQWSAISLECGELLESVASAVESARRAKQAETQAAMHQGLCDKKLSHRERQANTAAAKVAECFNTNRTYVKQAEKIKRVSPEIFERLKTGKITMQDAAKAARAIPTDPWMDDEKERRSIVESGGSVLANAGRDKNLIQWADKHGLSVKIDRGTEFGNPFILGPDGTREEVCQLYKDHYLPFKRSIKTKLHTLKGKVLVCHCYPEKCHGESLING